MDRGYQYIKGVKSGKIVVNRFILLAVQRFEKDISPKSDYYFDEEATQRAITLTEQLRFSKGRKSSEKIRWEPWQIFYMMNIFGLHRKGSGSRKYRYAHLEIARKNGKSTFAAAIGICFLMLFDEATPEIYIAASSKKQTLPVFGEMGRMITKLRRDFNEVDGDFAVFKEIIEYIPNDGIVNRVSSNADAQDGLSPYLTILDELHTYKDSSIYNVFKSGTGGRDNNTPLILSVTTAGFSLNSFAYSIRKNHIQILEGSKVDDDTFIMIYALDKDDDFNDSKNWIKSNPSLGASLSMEYLQSEYKQAQNFTSELNNFLTKNLNTWVGGLQVWLSQASLDANIGGELTEDEIDESLVYLGLDIGMVNDLSALAQISVFGDERIHVKMRYYLSELSYRRFIAQGVPMDRWSNEGTSINVNPGKVTDTRIIQQDIIDITENLDVQTIGIDRWASHQIVQQLDEEGIQVEGIGQGYKTQTEVISFIERAVAEERFVFEDDGMLMWMFSNVVLDQSPTGDRKLNKSKADDKIDGISALFNAIFCHIQAGLDGGTSDHGIRTLTFS